MGSRHSATLRYISLQIEAMATAAGSMQEPFRLPEGFKIVPFNNEAEYAWRQQWPPDSERTPPHGGWDWSKLMWDYRNDPTALAGSMWVNDQLSALFLGRLNNTAARIDYLEATPHVNHPLTGKVLPLAIEVGARYAQKAGRQELWLMEPVPKVREFSKRVGFEYVEPPGKTPFCRREV
jgi:hypothetical protein